MEPLASGRERRTHSESCPGQQERQPHSCPWPGAAHKHPSEFPGTGSRHAEASSITCWDAEAPRTAPKPSQWGSPKKPAPEAYTPPLSAPHPRLIVLARMGAHLRTFGMNAREGAHFNPAPVSRGESLLLKAGAHFFGWEVAGWNYSPPFLLNAKKKPHFSPPHHSASISGKDPPPSYLHLVKLERNSDHAQTLPASQISPS